jgi:hypothetical protein
MFCALGLDCIYTVSQLLDLTVSVGDMFTVIILTVVPSDQPLCPDGACDVSSSFEDCVDGTVSLIALFSLSPLPLSN